MPETLVTVSRRKHNSVGGTAHYEVLFSSRSLTRERAISVDHLADAYDQRRHENEHSDAIGVAALLESTARKYGTTAAELVDALCRVVPRQIGLSLDALTRPPAIFHTDRHSFCESLFPISGTCSRVRLRDRVQ